MKKVLVFAIAALGMTVNAQEASTPVSDVKVAEVSEVKEDKGVTKNYLPQQGDWSISFDASEVLKYAGNLLTDAGNAAPVFGGNQGVNGNFNVIDPATGATTISNSAKQVFVGKVMDTDMTATRYIFGFEMNIKNTTQVSTQVKDSKTRTSNLVLTAGYGKEWRKGTKRFQGYYGVDGLVQLSKAGGKISTDTFKADDKTGDRSDAQLSTKTKSKGGFGFGIGARGFAGVEYFILPKISLGVQYDYTAMFSRAANVTLGATDTTYHNSDLKPENEVKEPAKQKNGGQSDLTFSPMNAGSIRMAFYF